MCSVRLRVIWVFTFLVFAAVVFIIVYKNLKKKSGNDGETLVPSTDIITGGGDSGSSTN